MISKFLVFIFLIYGMLLVGYLTRRGGWVGDHMSASIMRKTIIFIEPIIIVLTFWAMQIADTRLLALPLAAALLSSLNLIPARIFSEFHRHAPDERGAYLGGSMFSNVGTTLGGFICFLLLGEVGLGLSIIYTVYFVPFFFTIGFYVARHYSGNAPQTLGESLKEFLTDPVRFMPNIALVIGLALNFSGRPRPEPLGSLNKTLVFLPVTFYSFSIGLTMRFRKVREYFPECVSMSLIKFLISPAIGIGLAYLLGLPSFMDGLPLKVVFIESAMPAAIFSLVLSRLFNLNQDLANSCWVFTTLAVLPAMPLIYMIVNLL